MDNINSTFQILKTRIGLKKLLLVAGCWLLVSLSALGQTTTTTLSASPGTWCINNNVTFTATISPAVGSTGTVQFRDGATVLATIPVSGSTATFITFFGLGNYSITAVYSGGGTFTGSTSDPLVQDVHFVPPTITASPASQSVCSGDLFQEITVSGISSFTWSRNYFDELVGPDQYSQGSVTSIVGAFTNLYGSTLTSTFSIIGVDANGCYGTTTANVTVNSPPALTAIAGPGEVCTGAANAITLTNSTPGGVWTSNDPTIASINSSTGVVTGIANGSVIITYTLTVNSCVNSVIKIINVKPSPDAAVTVNGDATICQGQVTSITGTSTIQPPISVVLTNNENTNNVRFAQGQPLVVLDKGILIDLLPYGISSMAGVTVTVTLRVDHPRDQEVELYLVAPWGNIDNCNRYMPYNQPYTQCFSTGVVVLSNNEGGTGSNFRNTVFSDAAANPISSGTAPFSATFRPETPFSGLAGNPNGTWRLRMVDEKNTGYTGVYYYWTISFSVPGSAGGGTTVWTSSPNDAAFQALAGNSPGTYQVSPSQTTTYTLSATFPDGCSSDSSRTITVVQPVTANAGPDQNKCGDGSFTLAGNDPAPGTGLWTVVAGTANITTPSSPTSGVTGVPAGTSATLRWTITNPPCANTFDDVVLTNSSASNNICHDICQGGTVSMTATAIFFRVSDNWANNNCAKCSLMRAQCYRYRNTQPGQILANILYR